jgi:hypothetical protein
MPRFHPPRRSRPGEPKPLLPFQSLSDLARALSRLQVRPPLHVSPSGTGRTLSFDPQQRRPIFVKLAGATSPYSWTQQRRTAAHGWENRPGGASGVSSAYEINSTVALDTMVVPLYRTARPDDWLFRWNVIVTPPPPPVECSNCILHWPSTLTNTIGGGAVTMTKVSSSSGTGYVGCQMVSDVSGWDWGANYGCGDFATCGVPLFWFLNCESLPGRSKRVVISCAYYAANPTWPFAQGCITHPTFGTPACTVKCNGPNGVGLGPIAGIGDCTNAAPGCSPWGFNAGVGCGGFFGSPQPCAQGLVTNGSSYIDLPDDFDCFGGIDLTFPALTTFSYSILTGTPHVTG